MQQVQLQARSDRLHFSVPDEGPLTDYESWMPDFMGGLAKGIEKSRSMIQNAVKDVASDMITNPDVSVGAESIYNGKSNESPSQNGLSNIWDH